MGHIMVNYFGVPCMGHIYLLECYSPSIGIIGDI